MKNQNGEGLLVVLLIILVFFFILSSNNTSNNKNIESTNTTNISNTTINAEPQNSTSTLGLGKEFKQAMDSYEKFMDEYIAFIKKYSNTNAPTSQMFIDYGEYMKKYVDWSDDFQKWEGKNLNKEETKYYIEVQMRVNQKLMNASIDLQYQ